MCQPHLIGHSTRRVCAEFSLHVPCIMTTKRITHDELEGQAQFFSSHTTAEDCEVWWLHCSACCSCRQLPSPLILRKMRGVVKRSRVHYFYHHPHQRAHKICLILTLHSYTFTQGHIAISADQLRSSTEFRAVPPEGAPSSSCPCKLSLGQASKTNGEDTIPKQQQHQKPLLPQAPPPPPTSLASAFCCPFLCSSPLAR